MLSEAPGHERAKAVVTLSAALVVGLVAAGATFSAFNSQANNTGNSFSAGTVRLADNDSDTKMFDVTGMRPGTPVERCIQVTYTGTLPAAVKLYGATTSAAGGLEAYLNVVVTRGTVSSGSFPSCAGFTADSSGSELFNGRLSTFPTTLAGAISDTNPAWSVNEVHAYRFTASVVDDVNAEGRTVTQNFTWDAR